MATTVAEAAVFVDTNVLIYASRSPSAFHGQATARVEALRASGAPLWISRQIMREYLAAVTRPQGVVVPASPTALALADVERFSRVFSVADEDGAVTDRLAELLARFPTAGRQVHDANIVATMLVNGVGRLLTANTADFARFSPVIDLEPL